ncbi:MAG: toll/interleukin-1 receptor domain-containing protein [Thermoplasmata archaeon]
MSSTYDLFLCHSGVDREWVKNLAIQVEREEVNGRRLRVFLDEWDIRPGENVILRINEGLTNSRFVGVVLSPEMVQAEWPTLEWTTALYQDPAGKRGRLLPILLRDCDVPPVLSVLNRLDFRRDASWRPELARLLAVLREAPLPREIERLSDELVGSGTRELKTGERSWEPDFQEEEIVTNLFGIASLPEYVFIGNTWARQPGDIFEVTRGKPIPPFVLREGRIYVFEDLTRRRSTLRKAAAVADVQTYSTKHLIDSESTQDYVVELLNRTFWKHCRSLGLAFDKVSGKHFSYAENGEPRTFGWKPNKRWSNREIARPKLYGGRVLFWVHLALRARFTILESDPYLVISPSWFHTVDGVEPVPIERRGPLITRRIYREGNGRVLSNLRLWLAYLGAGTESIKMRTGGPPLIVSCRPLSARLPRGIIGDYGKIRSIFEEAEAIDLEGIFRQGIDEASEDLGLEDENDDGPS